MKNMKRLIVVRRLDSKITVYLNTIEAEPSKFVKELYKIGRSLAFEFKTDLEIEERYEDGRSDGSTYIYYEDVKNMVDDYMHIFEDAKDALEDADHMIDETFDLYMNDLLQSQQALYDLTNIIYEF